MALLYPKMFYPPSTVIDVRLTRFCIRVPAAAPLCIWPDMRVCNKRSIYP